MGSTKRLSTLGGNGDIQEQCSRQPQSGESVVTNMPVDVGNNLIDHTWLNSIPARRSSALQKRKGQDKVISKEEKQQLG